MGFKGKARGGAEDKIHRRATWLSNNVFHERPIDDEAVAAMQGMGVERAMELFRELEEKSDVIKNPSGYLKNAARREGFGPPEDQEKGRGKGSRSGADPGKVRKRANWLNSNVFVDNPIDDPAVESMQGIDVSRAMEIFKELEAKGETVKNPSSYLRSASNREKERSGTALAVRAGGPAKSSGKGAVQSHEKIEKRTSWLSSHVFAANPIDEEAVAAMKGMGWARASELLRELEERSDRVRNPSMYLKKAAMREGFGPPSPGPAARASGPAARASGPAGGQDAQRVQKRVAWLNKHSFAANPIDSDAVDVMLEVDVPRAMEIFKELEGKADEVKNPSAYLISVVKKDGRGMKRKPPQTGARGNKQETQTKKAKVEE